MPFFKPCDIRGRVGSQLTDDHYRRFGVALGQMLQSGSLVAVGSDIRESSDPFRQALIAGLCEAGQRVADLGTVPTPVVYFARRRLDADACAIVTASHNPHGYNGLKWMIGNHPPDTEQVLRFRQLFDQTDQSDNNPKPGRSAEYDIRSHYIDWLRSIWTPETGPETEQEAEQKTGTVQQTTGDPPAIPSSPIQPLRVMLDPMHGTCSRLARHCLQAVFPDSMFDAIRDTADPRLESGPPDCSSPHELRHLVQSVERERPDIGIAFDGDGDRLALVDGLGVRFTPEETVWLLLDCFGEQIRDQRIVVDSKYSDQIFQRIESLGATPVPCRTGHLFMKRAMNESNALFGAETSGHYYFRALESGDDGLFAACWVLDYLRQSEQSLAEIRSSCPRIHITPELRMPHDSPTELLRLIEQSWGDQITDRLDGVRVRLDSGWALLRCSITEPKIICRFEGDSHSSLEQIITTICESLDQPGQKLWAMYTETLTGHRA